MKRILRVCLVSFILALMVSIPQSVFADCQIGPGKKVTIQVVFHGDKNNGSNITVNNVTRYRNPAQCTNPVASSTYTMSCDENTDANAADSVFPVLCQSGVERGKANSTCYQCGAGVIKCDGFDGALGQSNSMFSARQRCSMDNNNPNWSGDVYCPPPLDKDTKTFQYNGRDYDYHGELIIACGSNNQACGASEQCTNMAYPDITNHGESEKAECTTVTRTTSVAEDPDIRMGKRSWSASTETAKNLLDNIGGDNDAGKGPQLSTLFGALDTSPTITDLFQVNYSDGTPIKKDESSNWGVTLIELQTNPNGAIFAPKIGYDIGDGYNYTILYADEHEITLKGTREDNAVYGYTLHLVGLNVDTTLLSAYRANEINRANKLVAIPCGFQIGTPINSKVKVAVADTGTFMDPRVSKDWWNTPTNVSCANIGLGSVPLLTTQICTEIANPQVASQIPLPWLQNFVEKIFPPQLRDWAFNTFDLGTINFTNQTAKLTDLTPLGDQTESAVAKLKPKELAVQKLTHELSFSANTRLCHLSSNNEFKYTLPDRNVISNPYPGLNKVVPNSDFLAAALSTNELSKNDLNFNARYKDKILDVKNSLPCEVNNSGTTAQERTVQTTGNQEYTMPENKAPKYKLPSWFAEIAANIDGWIEKNKCNITACKVEKDMGAYIGLSTHASYIDTASKRIGKDGNTEKGFTNFLRPHEKKLSKTNQETRNDFDQSVGSNGEPLRQQPVVIFGGAGIKEYEKLMNCALLPKEKQQEKNMNCVFNDSPQPVNTSDWAITNTGFSPADFVPSGPFADILKQKAAKYGVPLCVMQGVSQIEGGSRYKELPLDQCVNTVNNCSAVGPMQFTIGPNPKSDCSKCAAGYCPAAWKNWGNNGNPCSYEDSLDAAAGYLAAFGHFTNAPAKDQVKSVHDATTAYYGSDNDKTARANLKGCEYWEYVYKQCNPAYTCKAANSAL